jgi:hypothetical protein
MHNSLAGEGDSIIEPAYHRAMRICGIFALREVACRPWVLDTHRSWIFLLTNFHAFLIRGARS